MLYEIKEARFFERFYKEGYRNFYWLNANNPGIYEEWFLYDIEIEHLYWLNIKKRVLDWLNNKDRLFVDIPSHYYMVLLEQGVK